MDCFCFQQGSRDSGGYGFRKLQLVSAGPRRVLRADWARRIQLRAKLTSWAILAGYRPKVKMIWVHHASPWYVDYQMEERKLCKTLHREVGIAFSVFERNGILQDPDTASNRKHCVSIALCDSKRMQSERCSNVFLRPIAWSAGVIGWLFYCR